MSALGLATGPIERVGASVAIVPLFAAERPLRDTAGRIDWRLCGRLSQLFAAGRLVGEPGEAVLMPGGGGVRASLVLGLGLGDRREVDGGASGRWALWVRDALERAVRLGADRVALGIPTFGETLAERLAELLAEVGRSSLPFELVLAPEPSERADAVEWLRRAAQRRQPAGVELRSPTETRLPQGGATSNPSPRSSRGTAGRFTR